MRKHLRFFGLVQLIALTAALAHAAPDYTPRVSRPQNEPWSDGPTLLWKHLNARAERPNASKPYIAERCLLNVKRLESINRASGMTIPTLDDMRNTLVGCNGVAGAIAKLQASAAGTPLAPTKRAETLSKVALAGRSRLQALFTKHGLDSQQQNLLADLMLWRNLAYNSNTLAHGSLAPTDGASTEFQRRARVGLENAVAATFNLGKRLSDGLSAGDQSKAWSWMDMQALHSATAWEFKDLNRQPGNPRDYNFGAPNPFGVDWRKLHFDDSGNPGRGIVHQFYTALEGDRRAAQHPLAARPLEFIARNLYWIHNVHPFCDGNGRTEMLTGWTLARGAGFPIPFDMDMASGEFKLAAAKWGGSSEDMAQHIAKGALKAERFARSLVPLVAGGKIVSNHADQGAVATVVKKGSERSALVMFPVTFAKAMDAELKAEKDKNRAVLTGDRFDPTRIRLEVNGQTLTPTVIHRWNPRYPWWSTVEPVYKVPLAAGATTLSFRVLGPDGSPVTPITYRMNLQDYSDINNRRWAQTGMPRVER